MGGWQLKRWNGTRGPERKKHGKRTKRCSGHNHHTKLSYSWSKAHAFGDTIISCKLPSCFYISQNFNEGIPSLPSGWWKHTQLVWRLSGKKSKNSALYLLCPRCPNAPDDPMTPDCVQITLVDTATVGESRSGFNQVPDTAYWHGRII